MSTDRRNGGESGHTPGPWGVYPYIRGYVVLRNVQTGHGTLGIEQALARDITIQYDAGRRDCFFVTQDAAFAAIAKANEDAARIAPAEAIRRLLSTMTDDNQIIDQQKWLSAMEGLRASLTQPAKATGSAS